ncbi:hypothetical protein [Streptomyces marianii]|uniref:Uncharacterized protein n=1 Tax=Streptomyces marianii TaxID=1817406 RepID=A0A5R9DS33_9ACTN|nr:hypothetical protein [Streptomyces marianii]TLQ39427.1 hypothetical protein FEF34_39310 [Streptomyces marianii]
MIVTRADGHSVRIGPIRRPEDAATIHTSLTRPTTDPEQAAATIEIAPFTPDAPHLPLLPATAETVLRLMDDDAQGAMAPFPNVWHRLVAQHGLSVADTVWKEALGRRPSVSSLQPVTGAQRRGSLAQADHRFDRAVRELLLENAGPGGMSPGALDRTLTGIRRLAHEWARSRHPVRDS